MNVRALCIALAVAVLAPSAVWAHSVNVWGEAVGDEVVGQVYFAGGGKAVGAAVKLLDCDDREHGSDSTNQDGEFTLTLPAPGEYRLFAELPDGHAAMYPITVEAAAAVTGGDDQLARRVAELSRRLDEYEHRIRFGDVVGGVGVIFGLFGLAMFFKARRRDGGTR